MLRKIVKIDQALCNGCGACARACHEGAIEMVDGKALLTREDYCDGLGDCLPACPAGAISFEEREALAYNEGAVRTSRLAMLRGEEDPGDCSNAPSRLTQWPVQIKLVPVRAPYFDGADVLVAADCSAFAFADFHGTFMRGRVTLVGCPKLDEGDYSEKLSAIFTENDVKSVTVARMEVPCCGGLESAVAKAAAASGKPIPCQTVTLSTDGRILRMRPHSL